MYGVLFSIKIQAVLHFMSKSQTISIGHWIWPQILKQLRKFTKYFAYFSIQTLLLSTTLASLRHQTEKQNSKAKNLRLHLTTTTRNIRRTPPHLF